MNIQEKIQWLENELKELKAQAKKEENKENWGPKGSDTCYSIDSIGDIYVWYWCGIKEDKDSYFIGNCFKTKEDAEFMVERLKVIQELKHFARPFRAKEKNWTITFDYIIKRVHIVFNMHIMDNTLYFESAEKAQKAIDYVGKDRVKKYYLQVKED